MVKNDKKTQKLNSLNKRALKVVEQYLNINVNGITTDTPYFINEVEKVYFESMEKAGIERSLIFKTIDFRKQAKTFLGYMAGKGSPKDITKSLRRLYKHLLKEGIDLEGMKRSEVKEFMKGAHIGVDCSGFVFNVLYLTINQKLRTKFLNSLDWLDERQQASNAGVFVFNSQKLKDVNDFTKIQPLDLIILDNNKHMGIIIKKAQKLYLCDSAVTSGGIKFSNIKVVNSELPASYAAGISNSVPRTPVAPKVMNCKNLRISNRSYWNREIKKHGITIKRITFL